MKKLFALLLCLSIMAVATACASKEEAPADTAPETESSEVVEETPEVQDDAEEETDTAEEAEETEEPAEAAPVDALTFTGVLEEKKDFMVIVTSEDQSQSYLFNLAEGVQVDAEVGDKITVTYTGDIEAPVADQDLTATAVEAAQ